MNDRFRFRVWDRENRRYAEFIYENFYEYLTMPNKFDVEQSTGLKDKNGRLIYEGDIIFSNLDYGGTYFVVVGGVRGYCYDAVAVEELKKYLELGKKTFGGLSSSAWHIVTDHGPCEVIGNIHENLELLSLAGSKGVRK